jgi:hypothetical protein
MSPEAAMPRRRKQAGNFFIFKRFLIQFYEGWERKRSWY